MQYSSFKHFKGKNPRLMFPLSISFFWKEYISSSIWIDKSNLEMRSLLFRVDKIIKNKAWLDL